MDRESSRSTRWRLLLAPWDGVAESLGQLFRAPTQCTSKPRGGIVWLQWDFKADDEYEVSFGGDDDELQRQLELMELLDLLARVDRVVFGEFVLCMCGRVEGAQLLHHMDRDDDDDGGGSFRFGYHIEVKNCAMLSSSRTIQRVIMGYSEMEALSAFRDVKRALIDALEAVTGKPFRRQDHPIPVRLDCAQRPQCDASWLFAIAQLAALQGSMGEFGAGKDRGLNSTDDLLEASVFRVRYVQINLVDEPDLASVMLKALSRIVLFGIEITYLRISTIYLTLVDPATLTRNLHDLFAPSQNPVYRHNKGGPVSGVRHLEINVLMEYWSFRRIFSAIAHSQTLSSLTLFEDNYTRHDIVESNVGDEHMGFRAQWLGFALFGPHATHSIETLRFAADLFIMEGAHKIADVVRDPFPVDYLDMVFENSPSNSFVDVPPQAKFWLRRPGGSSNSSTVIPHVCFPQGLIHIYVLGYDSSLQTEWLTVFLPGWGEAWVDAATIEKRVVKPNPKGHGARGIPRVSATGVLDSTVDLVVELFASVSSHTVELEINSAGSRLASESLSTILSAFPAVVTLQIEHASLESIKPIFDAHTFGETRLFETVNLKNVKLPEGVFLDLVTSKLADKNAPCWNHLRRISLYNVCEYSSDGYWRHLLHQECLDLLRTCLWLPQLYVVVDESDYEAFSNCVNVFDASHGQPTNVRKTPLAMPSKVTFLDVVRRSRSAATRVLASDVVSTIFQFAASTFVRRCAVHMRTRNEESNLHTD